MGLPKMGGLAGKILRVDLGNRKISTEDTEKYARFYLGGRALNSFLLLNELSPGTRHSDPENMLIFGVGCLVGTLAPGACRVSIDTKSAYNQGKGSANFGGHFGAELKFAGFDHVVITGKSPEPVYLWVHDGEVEIKSAASLWGRTTGETEARLREELGDPRVQVASIGPAGENGVRGSIIFTTPGKAAAGSGVGWVMGNKNLKAIAVRGRGEIRTADPKGFRAAVDRSLKKIKASPHAEGWRKGIIEAKFLPESPVWDFFASVRNGQDEYWPMEKRINLASLERGVPKYKKKMMSCFACPVGCIPFSKIDEGKYKGTRGAGYWINSATYSTKLDLDQAEASLRFHLMMNELGLDGDMCSTSLAWAFECFEKGLLTLEDCDGLGLRWGDEEAILEMQRKLAYREGIGDFLGDGVKESARRLGKGSEFFASHMKGQDSVDPYRAGKGWGFGCAISPVGGRHLRGAVSAPSVTGPKNLAWTPTQYENIPEAVFWQSQTKEIEDLAGFCIFVGTWSGAHALEVSDYADLISSATGLALTEEELMRVARRGVNLEKAFNTLHAGFDRGDDYPPRRFMEEEIQTGPYAGTKCEKEKWDEMLDRFYELNGWDRQTGWPTRKGMEELGLGEIAEMLERGGRLR
jgi:aldehyde:ferredoxin oxidoreductase